MLLLVLLSVCSNSFAVKNYYWNYAAEFPATDNDMLHGRAPLYLEAIRKLIYLIEYPMAGYYKDDSPSVIKVAGVNYPNVRNGELAGYLPVYDPNGFVLTAIQQDEGFGVRSMPYWGGGTPEYVAGNPATFEIDGQRVNPKQHGWIFQQPMYKEQHSEGTGAYNVYASGEVKIWCDGVVWMEKGTAKGYLPVKGQFYMCGQQGNAGYLGNYPPPKGGWFAPTANERWVKHPSKNNYQQWDRNSIREIWQSFVDAPAFGTVKTYNIHYDAHKQLVQQFDPYQLLRTQYKLPAEYLDNNELLEYATGETVPELNKYYYYDKAHLWKCLTNESEAVPSFDSDDWEFVNLFSSELSPLDFRFLPQGTAVTKHQFYKDDIQGAIYSSQNQMHEKPAYGYTQYRISTQLPFEHGVSGYYPEDIKMTETIMAYIERIFDGSQFRARVDSEFKINYDTIRGGMYGPNNKTYPNANGAVGRYNEAIKDNYVSFFMPLSDMAWGCNGSGFEWALKQCGEYVWYFDTENPYFYDTASWDFADIGYKEGRAELIAGVQKFIGNIRGTWRRTWNKSYGFPQKIKHLRPKEFEPRKGLFVGIQNYPSNTESVLEQWYSQAYVDGDTYDYTAWNTETYTIGATVEPVADPNTVELFEPDWSIYSGGKLVEMWSIDRMTDVVNHIWDVLNAPIGYTGNVIQIDTRYSATVIYAYAKVNEVNAQYDAAYAQMAADNYQTSYYAGSNYGAADGLDYEDFVESSNRGGRRAVFDLNNNAKMLAPNATINVGVSYYGDTWGIPEAPAMGLFGIVAAGGNASLPGISVQGSSSSGYAVASFDAHGSDSVIYIMPTPAYFAGDWGGDLVVNWLTSQVLFRYDWNDVPISLWYSDGNYPVLVNTFELPLKPPYPNPVNWVNTPRLDIDRIDTKRIVGNVCNATTVPAGRDVEYIFKLHTMYDISVDTTQRWSPDKTYSLNEEVQHESWIYRATYPNVNSVPYDGSINWNLIRIARGWNVLVHPEIISKYEYVDNFIQFKNDKPQETVKYDLKLSYGCDELLQNYLWFYNLCNWQVYGKTYDDGDTGTQLTYDGDKQILWGIETLRVDYTTGLDIGCSVGFEQQVDPNDNPIDVYDVTYSWNWLDKTAETLVDPNDNPVTTDDPDLTKLCEIHGYEPETKIWNDWTKTAKFIASNGKELPAVILPATEADWAGVTVRAEVTFTSPPAEGDEDIEHVFYTGWASILPSGGLSF